MPGPLLRDLDQAVETATFRALVEVVTNDAVLKSTVKRWEVMDGSSQTIRPPDTREMPYISLMPGPSPMRIAEAAAYEIEYTIYVTIATKGLHADDWTNLFGAFRKSLNYEKPFLTKTVATYLNDAGVYVHQVSNPGFAPWPPAKADGSTTAQDLIGTARVILLIRPQF